MTDKTLRGQDSMEKTYQLDCLQDLPQPRDAVFAFFADAGNLDRITPDFLHFRILTERPIEMRPGTRIEYSIRLLGVPLRWSTLIERFQPPESFLDTQESGPYKHWRHEHWFDATENGTRIVDRVSYQIPYGWLGRLAHFLFVRRLLRRIFNHRRRRIAEIFGVESAAANSPPVPA